MRPIVGPELEFYVLERTDKNPTGWQRYGEATGNVYVAGLKGDPENVLLRMLRHLSAYGLEVVAANHEFSSGQFEINLWHSEALDAADRAFRFKTAIQELARQEDKLATFLVGWMGGPQRYNERFGRVVIPAAHQRFDIGPAERDAWLACMQDAVDESALTPDMAKRVMDSFGKMAEMCRTRD